MSVQSHGVVTANTPNQPTDSTTSTFLSQSTLIPLLAGLTLVHGLAFGGLYAADLMRTVSNYQPILPIIGKLIVFLFGTLGMLAQLVAALLLFARSPRVVRATSPSVLCLVLIFGVACVAAKPFGEWSMVTFVGLSAIWPVILHLASKRASQRSSLPVPETGGYVIAGVILAGVGIGFVVSHVFASPPTDVSPTKVSLSEEPTPVIKVEAKTEQPGEILNRLVGHWDMFGEQDGEMRFVATVQATKLQKAPWVVWQSFDQEKVLREIQVTGFDATRSEYHHWHVGIGQLASHFVGTWEDDNCSFTWTASKSNGVKVVIRERIEGAIIRGTHERIENGVVQETSEFELRRTQPPLEYYWGSAVYKNYEGTWFTSTDTTIGEDARETTSRVIFTHLPNTTQMAALYFNNHSGNLADIQLVYFDGENKPLRRRWITNEGQPIELTGIFDAESDRIEWKGPLPGGSTMTLTDNFSESELSTTAMKLATNTGEVQIFAKTIWKRSEK